MREMKTPCKDTTAVYGEAQGTGGWAAKYPG